MDACCLPGASGRLCVAAAGKWAVCLWTQISASDWNLSHTWSFNEVNVWACLMTFVLVLPYSILILGTIRSFKCVISVCRW